MRVPTAPQFAAAMARLPIPGGDQLAFLKEHLKSTGRASTATKLAKAAGYKDFRGVNICYGRLARCIGGQLKRPDESLLLLVEFIAPRGVSNKDWVLVMRPEFAAGLKAAGWLR